MKIEGQTVINATRETTWDAVQDPAALKACLPGCESLTRLDDGTYEATITAGVASIRGTFEATIAFVDQNPPGSFRLQVSGAGAPGSVSGTVGVRLSDHDEGRTLLTYDGKVEVGGVVAGVGQRMLTSVANRMAGQFFDAFNGYLSAPAGAADSQVAAGRTEDIVTAGPKSGPLAVGTPAPTRAAGNTESPSFAGVALGGALVLAGVAVGAFVRGLRV